MLKIKIYIILFLSTSLSLVGQHYNFNSYNVEDGLSISQISHVFQSSSGHLYVGTYGGGYSVFDGISFQNFNTSNGLSDNSIYSITEDPAGTIWIGTGRGLSSFNGSNYKNYFVEDGLPANEILCLELIEGNNLLIGTSYGLCNFDLSTKKISNINLPSPNLQILSLNSSSLNNILVGTNNGLYEITGRKITRKFSNTIDSTYAITRILQDRKGVHWIASNKGLFKFVKNSYVHYTTRNGLLDNNISWITEDSQGKLWVASEKGLNKFDGKKFTSITSKESFADYKVWNIIEDRENNLWFSTDTGLYVLKNGEFRLYDKADGKTFSPWSIYEDNKKNILVGTDIRGLVQIKDDQLDLINSSYLLNNSIWAIHQDNRNRFWFATDSGLVRGSNGSYKRFNSTSGFVDDAVYSIYEDDKKNIWLGTGFNGIYYFDGKIFNNVKINTLNEFEMIYSITQDSNNIVWAGTERGIFKYEDNAFVIPADLKWLQKYSIMKIIPNRGKLIIGTYEIGIVIYDYTTSDGTARFEIIDEAKGLNSNAILLMILDSYNNLWAGTNNGLNKINYNEYLTGGELKILSFDKYDGFPGLECNQNAAAKDSDGNLWFGTIAGIVKVDPASVKQGFLEPKIYIKDFRILTQQPDVEYKSVLSEIPKEEEAYFEIPYQNNSVSIDFVGITLTNPQSVKYRYRLSGSVWSPETSKNSVSYSQLSPGEYTFQVICKNKNGIWNYSSAAINFEIVAPFWLTYWFYSGIGIFLLLIVYGVYRIRISTIKKQNKELEERIKFRLKYEKELEKSERELLIAKEKAERSDMLKSEFLAQMSHEIRTPINSILNFSNLLKSEMADKISDELHEGFSIIESGSKRLIRTVDSILNMSQIQTNSFEIFPTDIDINQILHNLKMEFDSFAQQKNLELKFVNKSSRNRLYGDEYTITQLFANLIDNSIKYTQSGFVSVELSSDENDNIIVKVIDSGVGMSEEFQKSLFEPFSQEETGYTRKFEGTGLGLALVKKYCELNNADISLTSEKGKGTTFTIVFYSKVDHLLNNA